MNENYYILKLLHKYKETNKQKTYIIGIYDNYKDAIIKYQGLCMNIYEQFIESNLLNENEYYVVFIYKFNKYYNDTFDIKNIKESELSYSLPCHMDIINKTWKLTYLNQIPIKL